MEPIRNAQGQKYTLQEFLRQFDKDALFQIESARYGHMITGSKDYITGHLDKLYFGTCIQGIEKIEYGTIIYLR